MTSKEFINEFDIGYNNIRSNGAPGLDLYEQSVFLTKAQEQLVFNHFNPKSNPMKDGFENSEKRRRDLEKLVKNYYTDNQVTTIEVASKALGVTLDNFESYFVEIPDNVFFIVQEKVFVSSDEGITEVAIQLLPLSHDEIILQADNPFRQPNNSIVSKRAWRLDNSIGSFDESVEIVVPIAEVVTNYQMRYVEKPTPIVLTDLTTGEFDGMGLSIDGITAETECQLSTIIQRQIIDRAVILAEESFEESRLQTSLAMSSRNE